MCFKSHVSKPIDKGLNPTSLYAFKESRKICVWIPPHSHHFRVSLVAVCPKKSAKINTLATSCFIGIYACTVDPLKHRLPLSQHGAAPKAKGAVTGVSSFNHGVIYVHTYVVSSPIYVIFDMHYSLTLILLDIMSFIGEVKYS